MLARLRRSLPPSGATAVDAAAAAAAGAAAQAGSVLDRLVSLAGPAPAEPALLPVRTKPASAGASPGLGRPSPGRRQRGGAPAGARRLRRAAAVAAMLLLVIAAVASAAAGAYLLSILYEPAAPLAAAAAEARAAASRAWAAAAPAGPAAPDPLQPDAAAAAGPDSLNGHARLPGNYTVVVMSYAGRRATLPLVVRKLGGCPSGAPACLGGCGAGRAEACRRLSQRLQLSALCCTDAHIAAAEVLVVWNGEDPPDPAGFGARAPVRVRREAQVRRRSDRPACPRQPAARAAPAAPPCRAAPPPHRTPCTQHQNDLSNRLFPDPGIATAAAYLADDDELVRWVLAAAVAARRGTAEPGGRAGAARQAEHLLVPGWLTWSQHRPRCAPHSPLPPSCADVERAFAAWQASPQALVGFWPRLVAPGPPPQVGARAGVAGEPARGCLPRGFLRPGPCPQAGCTIACGLPCRTPDPLRSALSQFIPPCLTRRPVLTSTSNTTTRSTWGSEPPLPRAPSTRC